MSSAEKALSDKKVSGAEQPDLDIEIQWIAKDTDKGPVDADALTLLAKNHLNTPADIHVSVRFEGMMGEVVNLDLDTHFLDAQGELILEVPSDDIPMQTTSGACQAVASIEATYSSSGSGASAFSASDVIFFRHKPNYKGLKMFNERVFVKQFGGRFTEDVSEKVHAGGLAAVSDIVLGRINRDGKGFEDVRIDTKKAEGKDGALSEPVLLGMSMGYGSPVTDGEEVRDEN